MGRCCPELLHREAILHKSELNHFPDCERHPRISGWMRPHTSKRQEEGELQE